jgi:hypothetical protein
METREAYRDKYEAQLKIWGAKVDVIKAQAEMVKAQAKIDLAPQVNVVHEKYEAAKAKLEHIAQATDDKWTDIMHDADKVWQDFEASVQGAFATIKSHSKKHDAKAN